jgi:hypothetical protein
MAPQVTEKSHILAMLQEEVTQKMEGKIARDDQANIAPEDKLIYIRY